MKYLALFLVALCSCAGPHVPNLVKVNDHVWRGGQPDAVGWSILAELGVTVDLKLNPVCEGSDAGAASNGITVVYLPITTIQQTIGKPAPADLRAAVAVLETTNVVYLHCTHGQDRTGLVIGAYRVQHGWSKADAYAEMKAHGFHPLLRGLHWAWEEDVPLKP